MRQRLNLLRGNNSFGRWQYVVNDRASTVKWPSGILTVHQVFGHGSAVHHAAVMLRSAAVLRHVDVVHSATVSGAFHLAFHADVLQVAAMVGMAGVVCVRVARVLLVRVHAHTALVLVVDGILVVGIFLFLVVRVAHLAVAVNFHHRFLYRQL